MSCLAIGESCEPFEESAAYTKSVLAKEVNSFTTRLSSYLLLTVLRSALVRISFLAIHYRYLKTRADISSRLVVIFGDPDDGQAVGSIPSSKVKVICHAGDNICDGGALVLPAHLTYGQDAGTAAAFAKSKL